MYLDRSQTTVNGKSYHRILLRQSFREALPQERVVGRVLQQPPHQVRHARQKLPVRRVNPHPVPERPDRFLDADTEAFSAHFVTGLLGPLLCEPGVSFVKGTDFGGAPNTARLAFSYVSPDEIHEGVHRLAAIVDQAVGVTT